MSFCTLPRLCLPLFVLSLGSEPVSTFQRTVPCRLPFLLRGATCCLPGAAQWTSSLFCQSTSSRSRQHRFHTTRGMPHARSPLASRLILVSAPAVHDSRYTERESDHNSVQDDTHKCRRKSTRARAARPHTHRHTHDARGVYTPHCACLLYTLTLPTICSV